MNTAIENRCNTLSQLECRASVFWAGIYSSRNSGRMWHEEVFNLRCPYADIWAKAPNCPISTTTITLIVNHQPSFFSPTMEVLLKDFESQVLGIPHNFKRKRGQILHFDPSPKAEKCALSRSRSLKERNFKTKKRAQSLLWSQVKILEPTYWFQTKKTDTILTRGRSHFYDNKSYKNCCVAINILF